MSHKQYQRIFRDAFNQYESKNSWNNVFGIIHVSTHKEVEKSGYGFTVSRSEINSFRNRYIDVLPYDECRVGIKPRADNPEGYINASPVVVKEAKRNYILCQGPLDSTCEDFWQMIWEQNVPLIVMLNKIIEGGRMKCFPYYPSENNTEMTYGNFKVTFKEVTSKATMSHSVFKLENIEKNESKTVHHVQYTEWPDFGVPPSSDCFLSMLNYIKDLNVLSTKETDPPCVVHCSAGIGRSGSFVFVDSIIRMAELNVEMKHSIPDHLVQMRLQRLGLIQTPSQLKFAWMAVIDELGKINETSNGKEGTSTETNADSKKEETNKKKDEDEKQGQQQQQLEDKQDQRNEKTGKRCSSSSNEALQAVVEKSKDEDSTLVKRREMIERMVEKSRASAAASARYSKLIDEYGLGSSWKLTMSVGAAVAAAFVAFYLTKK